jgi:phosphoglycolate phosphatase
MRIVVLILFYMPSPDKIVNVKEIKNVIFDLDGTLIDSAPSILDAFDKTLQQFSYKPMKPLESGLIGPPLKTTLQEISGEVDPEKLDMLVEGFKKSYDNEAYASSISYPGIVEMLEKLALAGMYLHIATNKRLIPTQKIIDFFEWGKYFKTIYAIDRVIPVYSNKAHMLQSMMVDLSLQSTNCIYIGDRLEDNEAANANAIPFIYVSWGYGPDDSQVKHLQVASDPKELLVTICGH